MDNAPASRVRALLVPDEDGVPVSEVLIDGSYEGVCTALHVPTADMVDLGDGVAMWVDGYGQLTSRPMNGRASRLVNTFIPGWTMAARAHGPAVFVGLDQGSGVYADVPAGVVDRQRAIN